MLLNVLQLAGIGVFAASGAFAAVRSRLDVFGVVVVGDSLQLPPGPVAVVGSALVVVIRALALWRRWNAPTAPDTA
jgi:uncharacterized membrane protein YeiH